MGGDQLFPTDTGVSQGAVVSPLLANVALHGLETVIETAFPAYRGRQRWRPTVMRCADDFVVLHRNGSIRRFLEARLGGIQEGALPLFKPNSPPNS